jgi:Xaa-Pro dipeptidase
MNHTRLQRLQQMILSHGLDGIALVPGTSMVYFSDIHAHMSERPVVLFVPADDDPAIIIPGLEAEKARQAGIAETSLFSYSDQEGHAGAFQRACAHLELADYLLGVEAYRMRVVELELLHRYAPGLQTAHAEEIITALRGVKDQEELQKMQQAVTIAETAIERLLPTIASGQTEREIGNRLVRELLEAGSQGMPFGPIVAAGPNAAAPHATLSDRPIAAGDLLIIDWGAGYEGYVSDITRTYAVGSVDRDLQRVHETVRRANEAGRQASRPGATGEAIDRAAREVIEQAGYGSYFIHRTGHGLGMEAHEPPSIVEGNLDPLQPGNVFTVEPGIYLPGRGGVRIEDDVVITAQGHRSLTSLPRELISVG